MGIFKTRGGGREAAAPILFFKLSSPVVHDFDRYHRGLENPHFLLK